MPVLIIIIAFISSILQSTWIPAFQILGGFPDVTLAILLILLFFGWRRLAGIYIISVAIFIPIFSSVKMATIIIPYFVIFLTYIFLNNRRLVSRPSVTLSVFIFILADLLRMIIQALVSNNINILSAVISGAILTAISGTVIYYLSRRFYFFLNPQILRDKIKIISHL